MSSSRPKQEAADAPPTPTLTVAAVARRLGVAPATLRTWARRYGLGPSAHTAGAHRRYSGADLTRLVVMRRLTLEGVAPGEAARIALSTEVDDDAGTSLATVTTLPAPGPPADLPSDFGRAGGGNVVALPDAGPAARGLARASLALDSRECIRILQAAVDVQGVQQAWQQLVLPVMVALGKRWETTGTGIDAEHLLSESVLAVLRAHSLAQPVRTQATVLLACAEDDQHSLPVHVVAAALSEKGISARVLGARVPREALAAAVRRSGPAAVLVYASMPVSDPGQLLELPRMRPSPRVLVGGPGWQEVEVPEGIDVVRVGSLGHAVAELEAAVSG
jgi:MerR family transcriptional regulator, light-induced transcriptional regulator